MDDLVLLTESVFHWLTAIFALHTTNFIFQGVLALWIIRRISKIFNHL